jgi:phosphate butyryltransferase
VKPQELLAIAPRDTSVVVAGPDPTISEAIEHHGPWRSLVVNDPTGNPAKIAQAAVEKCGPADILAKGGIPTADVARALLRATGTNDRLVHVAWAYLGSLGRSVIIADAGINLEPEGEVQTILAERALHVAQRLGMSGGIALLGHSDAADHRVQSSVRAGEWAERLRGEAAFDGVNVIGPVSLDLALDPVARERKRHNDFPPIDILLAPEIVTANVLYKALMLSGDCVVAGIALATKISAAVPSRSSDRLEKGLSIALAAAANYGCCGPPGIRDQPG